MSIDTGQSPLSFNPNFPVANQNQSSQQFRDNFSIIKVAVENLQQFVTTANSVLTLTTSVQPDSTMFATLSYTNNSFTLPVGSPTGNAVAGMLQYDNVRNVVSYYNGTTWNPLLTQSGGTSVLTNLEVTTNLKLDFTPIANTDATTVGYVAGQLGLQWANTLTLASGLQANIAAVQTNLSAETSRAESAESSLSSRVSVIENATTNANSATSLASQIATTQAALTQEIQNRANSETAILAQVETNTDGVVLVNANVATLNGNFVAYMQTQSNINNSVTQQFNLVAAANTATNQSIANLALQVSNAQANAQSSVASEQQARIAADQNLQNQINSQIITISGLSGLWTPTVNANNAVNGFSIASDALSDTTPDIPVLFQADQVQLVDANAVTFATPFVVNTVANAIYLDPRMVAPLWNSVTVSQSGVLHAGANAVVVASYALQTDGNTVVSFSGQVTLNTGEIVSPAGTQAVVYYASLLMDNTVVGRSVITSAPTALTNATLVGNAYTFTYTTFGAGTGTVLASLTPDANSHTYAWRVEGEPILAIPAVISNGTLNVRTFSRS